MNYSAPGEYYRKEKSRLWDHVRVEVYSQNINELLFRILKVDEDNIEAE